MHCIEAARRKTFDDCFQILMAQLCQKIIKENSEKRYECYVMQRRIMGL
jgi:hypothetical protein